MPLDTSNVADHLASLRMIQRGISDFSTKHTLVRGIALGWRPDRQTIAEAQAHNCNLLITQNDPLGSLQIGTASQLATDDATILTCGDMWLDHPDLGTYAALISHLNLAPPLRSSSGSHTYPVPAMSVWELAQRIGHRLRDLDEQAVHLSGQRWRMVTRLGIALESAIDVDALLATGTDAVLATNRANDLLGLAQRLDAHNIPLIVIDAATAAAPGLRMLAAHLEKRYAGTPVSIVGPTCAFEIYAQETFRYKPIRMRRDSLDSLPTPKLPEGYTCRPMRAEESWAYLQVMNRSTHDGEADAKWFHNTYAQDPQYDPSFLQIVWKADQPVAVAGAWHREIDGQLWGMIHWVGADYAERGQGLGKAVTLAALQRLRERGFDRAMLSTQVWRLAAVAAYLRLGFQPWPADDTQQKVWEQVLQDLDEWRQASISPRDTVLTKLGLYVIL